MKRLLKCAMVAAIYFILTIALEPISFGAIQFRASEMLMPLCIYRLDYVFALTLGCALSNIFSSYGFIDIIFGSLATLISGLLMYFIKKKYINWIFPVLLNAIIIGLEIVILGELEPFIRSFIISASTVAGGEALVVIVGLIIFSRLEKNDTIKELIEGNDNERFEENEDQSE